MSAIEAQSIERLKKLPPSRVAEVVEDRELLKRFQEVGQLPDEDKNVVKKLLDAFLTKKQSQALAR